MHLLRGYRFVALAAVVASASFGIGQYSITEIGTFRGNSSNAFAVNSSGQVTGWADDSSGVNRGYIWSNGTMTHLGNLGGGRSEGNAINESGVVTGFSTNSSSNAQAFIYNGTMSSLGTLGGNLSYGYAINNSGQVAGPSQITGSTAYRSFISAPGGLQEIQSVNSATTTWAYGMNDAGSVVGCTLISGVTGARGFYFDGTNTVAIGTGTSRAYDINNLNQITGFSRDFTGMDRAYILQGSVMTDLGTLGGFTSHGYAINDSGVVVGEAANAAGQTRAAVFSNGVVTDLNSFLDPNSGWVLNSARGISENGYIVGIGTLNGATRGFVIAPVPEPATLAILAPALLMLRRRKKSQK